MLIHGFGVSSFQYRETLKALSLTNKVYAIDLVGFGSSGASGHDTCFHMASCPCAQECIHPVFPAPVCPERCFFARTNC